MKNKLLLFALTIFLLFSCSMKNEAEINSSRVKNQFVEIANINGLSVKVKGYQKHKYSCLEFNIKNEKVLVYIDSNLNLFGISLDPNYEFDKEIIVNSDSQLKHIENDSVIIRSKIGSHRVNEFPETVINLEMSAKLDSNRFVICLSSKYFESKFLLFYFERLKNNNSFVFLNCYSMDSLDE